MIRLLAPAMLLLLTGCSGLRPVADQPLGWDARRSALLQLADWSFRGRVAVRYGSDGGQGGIDWAQVASETRVRVNGPFGAGAWELVWTPTEVVLTRRGEDRSEHYTGPDAAESFMREQLGWSFPAGSTRYWVLGVLDPAFDGLEVFDPEDGDLVRLEQGGWTVSLERFVQQDQLLLPDRLVLENPRTRIRLAISRWAL